MPRQERLQSATGIYHVMFRMKNDGTFGPIDDLTITYDGNHLRKVTDAAETLNYNGALDFDDGDDSYTEYHYDADGALTYDSNRGINSITYDYSHYPSTIARLTQLKTVYNDYTPDGKKLFSRHLSYIPNGNGSNTRVNIQDLYIDDLMLRGGTPLMWKFNGGYVELNANGAPTSWNYYVTDHLGSTRMIVDSNDSIKEVINYYPFGSEMRMTNPALLTGGTSHPYRFTGKELDKLNNLNMYDFGARWYDMAGVPMWTSVDPLAEEYYNVSPYSYCTNNPVNAIDINGDSIFIGYEYQNEVLNMINKLSAGIFGVSENGYLYLMSKTKQEDNNGNYSSYYRDMLIEGINATNTAYVFVTDKGSVNFFNQEINLKEHGEGATASFENGTAYTYVSGKDYSKEGFYSRPEIVLAHELAGHAVPTIIHPSNLDIRFDGNAVTAENIIRGEIGMDLRPVNEYARKDWAVRDMTTSIAKAYLRHLFPKLNFNY